jgi:pimeloyl-ACP methyl ester carboxylesterase
MTAAAVSARAFRSTPAAATQETLLCLHSSGSSGRQWAALQPLLSPRLRVLTPALLGYDGAAPWPAGTPVSLDEEAERLRPLLGAGGAHLFGHSYGGAVALQIALRWPQQVQSLTLFEPVRFALLMHHPETVASAEAIVAVGRRIGMEVLAGALPAAAHRFVDYWSGDGAWVALGEHHRDALAARMPKVRAEFEALFADPVPAAAYRALRMPVHLMGGERSPLPARQVLALLAGALPQAGGVTLRGLGHMAPVTHAGRVAAHLPAWLLPVALADAA